MMILTTMIVEWLKHTIFANKLILDDRTFEHDAVVTVTIPDILVKLVLFPSGSDSDESDGSNSAASAAAAAATSTTTICGLLLPNFVFYYQFVVILILQAIYNFILGSFIYTMIIEPRQKQKQQQQQQYQYHNRDDDGKAQASASVLLSSSSSSSSWDLLVGLGVALPLVIVQPLYMIRTLDIQNIGLLMVFLATPIVNSLRILEAIFDYVQPTTVSVTTSASAVAGATASIPVIITIQYWDYVKYFSCPFAIKFENTEDSVTTTDGTAPTIAATTTTANKTSTMGTHNNTSYIRYRATPKRMTKHGYITNRVILISRDFIILSLLLSVLKEYNYEVFTLPTTTKTPRMDMDYHDWLVTIIKQSFFSWQHILNNFLVVCLLSTALSQGSSCISLLYSICWDCEVYQMVRNPMFSSTSISEFWGRRWNMVVHNGLKHGIYKPIRSYTTSTNTIAIINPKYSKYIAAFFTFLVSGLIHECVNLVIFHNRESSSHHQYPSSSYQFQWKQILFFGWNGILIILEYWIFNQTNNNDNDNNNNTNGKNTSSLFAVVLDRIVQFRGYLPSLVVTACVLYLALPIAHLFTESYIQYGFFDDIYIAEPVIMCRVS